MDAFGNVYMTFMADSNPAHNSDSSGNIILANVDADVFVGVSNNGASTFTVRDITANNVQNGVDADEVFPAIAVTSTNTTVMSMIPTRLMITKFPEH